MLRKFDKFSRFGRFGAACGWPRRLRHSTKQTGLTSLLQLAAVFAVEIIIDGPYSYKSSVIGYYSEPYFIYCNCAWETFPADLFLVGTFLLF